MQTLKVNSQVKIEYEYLGISFYPEKCIDTLSFEISNQEFHSCVAKVYLLDCRGKCSFFVYDKKGNIKLKGYYENSVDTLKKYHNAKDVLNSTINKQYTVVRVLRYFSPLRENTWIFYDKNQKVVKAITYHNKFGEVNE
jgi:hypothetical protein